MIKRIVPFALLGAALIGNSGCGNNATLKKTHGLEYMIVKDVPGKNAQKGEWVEFNIKAKADTTEIANTYKMNQPGALQVGEPKGSGDLVAVLPFLSKGDSAVIYLSCDTILKSIPADQLERAQKMQPWLRKGNKITINLSVVSVKTDAEYQKTMQTKREEMMAKQKQAMAERKEREAKQLPLDDKALQDYFAKNNIKASKTASGVYYTIQKPGSGAQITSGQIVSMMYTGKTLDGKAFDSNVDTTIGHHGTEPLTFPVGQHQMIPGVDEGVALLKKGTKATLYLPSPLGYGEQAPPNIGANAILVFDVEITDVKAAPKKEESPIGPAQ